MASAKQIYANDLADAAASSAIVDVSTANPAKDANKNG